MNLLLTVSVALLAGLLMTRLFKHLKLPAVTAYLIAGIIIGPYCIGRLGLDGIGFGTLEQVSSLSIISEVALGFIAFSIGSEFKLSELKKTGKQALVIGIFQALVATLFVDLALLVVHLIMPDKLSVPQLLTLGAIATATAPAAIPAANKPNLAQEFIIKYSFQNLKKHYFLISFFYYNIKIPLSQLPIIKVFLSTHKT